MPTGQDRTPLHLCKPCYIRQFLVISSSNRTTVSDIHHLNPLLALNSIWWRSEHSRNIDFVTLAAWLAWRKYFSVILQLCKIMYSIQTIQVKQSPICCPIITISQLVIDNLNKVKSKISQSICEILRKWKEKFNICPSRGKHALTWQQSSPFLARTLFEQCCLMM